MPVIQLKTNCDLQEDKKKEIILDTASIIAEILEKPLENVMVMLNSEEFAMGENTTDIAAFADIKFIGSADADKKQRVCDSILEIFIKYLNVDPRRVYMFINPVTVESAWKYKESVGKNICNGL